MTTALYRRYRPESFAEVIGQEQVTGPLSTALTKNRVNHAYLFSGPRGCGKTTSARILARCLNCVDGPTPTPCGVCPSCIELARGGPGSLDVVEIDAASHGGVDDARDLRERAAFAPVRDRFKVFIIDEAHMVSPQGFNALLKIVEEPPEHIRFIFATTEPEKVIGTIRSRTHHYPFRLVPPERLVTYLAELCEREGVQAGKGVLPLVVRSGGGSVRDSLSVLDQLIGGAGDEGLAYSTAVSLLGYTDVALLDDVTDALAAGDGGTVFRVIDRVIESGHDPRRFVEDLLERLRDLLVVAAMRDGGHAVFRGLPDDQLERMRSQAGRFGAAELSRAADIANAALTEMTGATSPRLQLELLCARLLLPSAEEGERGLAARLDRLEKRMNVSGGLVAAPVAAPTPAAPVVPAPLASAPPVTAPSAGPAGSSATAPADRPRPDAGGPTATVADWPEPSRPAGGEPRPTSAAPTSAAPTAAAPTSPGGPATPAPPLTAPSASAAPPAPPAPAASATGHGDLDAVRRMWTEVLNTLGTLKRTTWSLVSQYAQVLDYDGQRLLLGFDSAGRAQSFGRGAHPDFLRQALIDVIGLDCKVEAIASSAFRGGGSPGSPTSAGAPGPAPARATGAVRPPDPAVSSRTGAGGFADSGAGAGAGSAGTVPSGGPDASARAGSSAHADPSTHADPSGRSGAAGSAGPTGTASPADAAGSAGPAGWSGEAGSSGGAGRSAGSNRSGRTPSTGSSAPHWTSPPPGAGSGPGGPASAARSEGATRPAGRRPSPPVSPYDDIPPPLEEPPDEEQLPPDDGRSGSRAWPTAAAVNRSAPAPATRPVVASTAPEPVISASPVARPSDHRAGPARRIDLADHGPSGDDPSLEASHLVGAQVVQQLLGGRVIEGHDQ